MHSLQLLLDISADPLLRPIASKLLRLVCRTADEMWLVNDWAPSDLVHGRDAPGSETWAAASAPGAVVVFSRAEADRFGSIALLSRHAEVVKSDVVVASVDDFGRTVVFDLEGAAAVEALLNLSQ